MLGSKISGTVEPKAVGLFVTSCGTSATDGEESGFQNPFVERLCSDGTINVL